MWTIKDTTIDELFELYDYYQENPLETERVKREIEEEMKFVDECLLGGVEEDEEEHNQENGKKKFE